MELKEITELLITARAEEKGIEKGIGQGIEQGIQKGKQEKNSLFVTKLIQSTNFSDEKILAFLMCQSNLYSKCKRNWVSDALPTPSLPSPL